LHTAELNYTNMIENSFGQVHQQSKIWFCKHYLLGFGSIKRWSHRSPVRASKRI